MNREVYAYVFVDRKKSLEKFELSWEEYFRVLKRANWYIPKDPGGYVWDGHLFTGQGIVHGARDNNMRPHCGTCRLELVEDIQGKVWGAIKKPSNDWFVCYHCMIVEKALDVRSTMKKYREHELWKEKNKSWRRIIGLPD